MKLPRKTQRANIDIQQTGKYEYDWCATWLQIIRLITITFSKIIVISQVVQS